METELTQVKVLKTGITQVNPFIFEMPVAGKHLNVYGALNNVFVEAGQVFAGKIDEMVMLGVEAGLEESDLREAFEDLERYGFLTISDGVFTPTEQYLRKFLP